MEQSIGEDRIKVILFEQLISNPQKWMKDISEFAGIDPSFFDGYSFPKDNETYTVKSPLLQTLNIKVRSTIPKGKVYNLMRSIYRSLNTSYSYNKKNQLDLDLINELRAEFTHSNRQLAENFSINLSLWQEK